MACRAYPIRSEACQSADARIVKTYPAFLAKGRAGSSLFYSRLVT